jgi:hypothetical protein
MVQASRPNVGAWRLDATGSDALTDSCTTLTTSGAVDMRTESRRWRRSSLRDQCPAAAKSSPGPAHNPKESHPRRDTGRVSCPAGRTTRTGALRPCSCARSGSPARLALQPPCTDGRSSCDEDEPVAEPPRAAVRKPAISTPTPSTARRAPRLNLIPVSVNLAPQRRAGRRALRSPFPRRSDSCALCQLPGALPALAADVHRRPRRVRGGLRSRGLAPGSDRGC